MNLVAFDLEIAKTLPEGEVDLQQERPLGVSCAAIQGTDGSRVAFPRKNKDTVRGLRAFYNLGKARQG